MTRNENNVPKNLIIVITITLRLKKGLNLNLIDSTHITHLVREEDNLNNLNRLEIYTKLSFKSL